MPFYEYECQACKFYTEVMQKISDAPLTKCPSCGKRRLKKLVSAPVFRLKGGGWYETDFKREGDKKRNLVETSSSESSGESSDSTKSADATKSDASAKAEGAAKETKKPAEKPAASEVKKPRKTRAAGPKRT
jgi:putative FmdB family regulatory protein